MKCFNDSTKYSLQFDKPFSTTCVYEMVTIGRKEKKILVMTVHQCSSRCIA